nr:TonB-dependent receptor plug domain-containing protein [uncultured Carboxylicivirga sp.]
MKAYKYLSPIIVLPLLTGLFSFTGIDELFIGFLKKRLVEYNLYYPVEKTYLHTDKTFYKPGDDIWISGYLVDGITYEASDISTVLYIELIDPKGSVSQRKKFMVKNGQSKAHLFLPENAPGGIYQLKAYTRWMQNFGEKLVFEKKLQVQNIIKPNLLSVLDFEKEAYGAGDTVSASINIRDLQNQPVANRQLSFSVMLKGTEFKKDIAFTNEEGNASIQFILPDKLNSSDGVLNVVFSYKGRNESISRSIPIVLNVIDLQFFPEGGDAVEMLPCHMAFKALNEFGKPADVEGEIRDSKDRLIKTFASFHQGMGAFDFVPDSNETYRAIVLKPAGIRKTYYLPKPNAEGFVLHLDRREGDDYKFSIYSNVEEKVHIVVQARSEILYTQSRMLKKGKITENIRLDKNQLSGVAQITVFDDFERPLAERLFYVFPENKLSIDITTDKTTYAPREKVKMSLKVRDKKGEPVEGNFSLAVVDDKIVTFADDKQDNILSYLLLSSEVRGEIYEPSFYFNPEKEKASEAMDYLLLTQGWRRFVWKDILELEKKRLTEAERYDRVSGRIINSYGQGVKSRVIVIDNENKKYSKIITNEGGRFSVSGLDNYNYLQIFAKSLDRKNKYVNINISQSVNNVANRSAVSPTIFGTAQVNALIAETRNVNNSMAMEDEIIEDSEVIVSASNQKRVSAAWSMEEDAVALDEVVTIGYGTQRASSVTGAVMYVKAEDLNRVSSDVNYALQGQVAGVQVINGSGAPGANSSVMIRGVSSVSANNTPLYVVDGIPVTDVNNINSNEIDRIEVLKSASASAIYGCRGANGVIFINTKKGNYGHYYRQRKYSRKMAQNFVSGGYRFEKVKEFYVPRYGNEDPKEFDKRETVYWNPSITTDENGNAEVEFVNTDEVTTFRATVEGIGNNGLIGRTEGFYSVQKPLQMEAKVPPYVTFEDEVEVAVLITNNTENSIEGELKVDYPQSWNIKDQPISIVEVDSESFKEVILKFYVGPKTGNDSLSFSFGNEQYQTELVAETNIVSKGFPAEMSYSSRAVQTEFSFDLSSAVDKSEHMSISVYNNVLAEVMDGIESVIRQPHGCFEQVSASTYPNVLILKYLEETSNVDADLRTKTLKYIDEGYKKLAGYETKENGFEWFGKTPPHEGLTAFGLMEFYDMKQVYNGVDEAILKRTIEWLLSRKNGKGGFDTNKGKYGFSGASDEVTNAYMVYAFSEVGLPFNDYEAEFTKSFEEAMRSKDAYRMALMANACLNRKDQVKAAQLIDYIIKKLQKGRVEDLKSSHSIVRSWGKSLQVETAALSAMALMKNGDEHFVELLTLMDYILGARSFGGFGSTQATVLSLKAITQYASIVNKMPENGSLVLKINNKEVLTRKISAEDKLIVLDSLEQYLSSGVQTFNLEFKGVRNPLSFTANAQWMQTVPVSSEKCKVQLKTNLMKSECQINDLVRLSAQLKNKTRSGLPMTIAMVGIPSGLSVQPWQLKKMQEENVFDYYEIHQNYLVLYYREMPSSVVKTINLDLKAEVAGTYTAPASCAYLYYTKEHKDWQKGEQIKITNP